MRYFSGNTINDTTILVQNKNGRNVKIELSQLFLIFAIAVLGKFKT